MPLDRNRVEKTLSKLKKSLKRVPRRPSPEQIHDIRTRTRRTEATLHALSLDRGRLGQRVCEAVAPIRKRAGKVRDMDVLTGFASTLNGNKDRECLVELLEYLGHQRFREVRKLRSTADHKRAVAIRALKRCASSIRRTLADDGKRKEWEAEVSADAQSLSGELAGWPKLTAGNLHPFRLKVKQLRYVLELSGQDDALGDHLGKVKDEIGEWHDWSELAAIAQEVLSHPGRCGIRQQIGLRAKQHLEQSLALANQLRTRYFGRRDTHNAETGRRTAVEASLKLVA